MHTQEHTNIYIKAFYKCHRLLWRTVLFTRMSYYRLDCYSNPSTNTVLQRSLFEESKVRMSEMLGMSGRLWQYPGNKKGTHVCYVLCFTWQQCVCLCFSVPYSCLWQYNLSLNATTYWFTNTQRWHVNRNCHKRWQLCWIIKRQRMGSKVFHVLT